MTRNYQEEFRVNSEVEQELLDRDERIAELESTNNTLLSCMLDISNECVGEIAMGYRLDASSIGNSIYQATGKTNPELATALKEKDSD